MKTRGEAIAEYSNAFKKEDKFVETATILHQKMSWLFSESAQNMKKEEKIRCIAEEIDNILCGYSEKERKSSQKEGAYHG